MKTNTDNIIMLSIIILAAGFLIIQTTNNSITGFATHPIYPNYSLPEKITIGFHQFEFDNETNTTILPVIVQDDFIYLFAYRSYDGDNWTKVNLSTQRPIKNNWTRNRAVINFTINKDQFRINKTRNKSTDNYIAVYTCTRNQTNNSRDCHDGWQIVQFNASFRNNITHECNIDLDCDDGNISTTDTCESTYPRTCNHTNSQYITPATFGAIGDGVANDTQALIDFFNWVETNNSENFYLDQNVNYLTTANIELYVNKNITIDGRNSTIKRDYNISNGELIGLYVSGNVDAIGKTLATNIQEGDTSLTVTDSSGIEIGMGIKLLGNFWGNSSAQQTYDKGMMTVITGVSGNNIYLKDPSPHNFSSNNITEFKIMPVNSVTINNLNFDGFNHLEKPLAGSARHLRMDNLFYPTLYNVDFKSPAYAIMATRWIYGGIFENLETTYGYGIEGVYGIAANLNVNTIIRNVDVRALSVGFTATGNPCYNLTFTNATFISGSVGDGANRYSFDSHTSKSIFVYNSLMYGFGWTHADLLISNSTIKPDINNGFIMLTRGGFPRNLNITVENSFINSDVGVPITESNDFGGENNPNTIRFANNTFNNEDIIMHPYTDILFESNKFNINGSEYNLPNNINPISEHQNKYYNFTGATEGITTPVNLNGLNKFTLLIKAKLGTLDFGTTTPLASVHTGPLNFWFRFYNKAEKDNIEIRMLDQDGIGLTQFAQHILDDNIHTYGFTFDGTKGIRVYIDGFLIGTLDYTAGPYDNVDHFLTLGERFGSIWKGSMEEAAFYNRALSNEEVILATQNPNLVSDYTMYLGNNKTETVWYDESSNNNDGTIGSGIILTNP